MAESLQEQFKWWRWRMKNRWYKLVCGIRGHQMTIEIGGGADREYCERCHDIKVVRVLRLYMYDGNDQYPYGKDLWLKLCGPHIEAYRRFMKETRHDEI